MAINIDLLPQKADKKFDKGVSSCKRLVNSAPITYIVDMDTSILDKAIVFAVKAHQGAERKGKGFPYIVHPMEAVAIAATMTNDQ